MGRSGRVPMAFTPESRWFTPVLAEPTTRELLRVLAYPTFRLDPM